MDGSIRLTHRRIWPRHARRLGSALLASLTLGLAPFYPHAHVWKQLVNLARGTLTQPIDIFDLVLHGTPWVVLFTLLTLYAVDLSREHARSPRSPA